MFFKNYFIIKYSVGQIIAKNREWVGNGLNTRDKSLRFK